jgi:hypothetical protein
MLSSLDSIIFFMPPIFTSFFSLLHPPPLILATRDESGTDIIRPTDRPKGSDTQMVRLYSNPDI